MIKYLIHKEFLQIRRNGFLPRLIIMFPIMIMCIMPWVMNQEVKNVRVDVVDIDRTTQSQQLVHHPRHDAHDHDGEHDDETGQETVAPYLQELLGD